MPAVTKLFGTAVWAHLRSREDEAQLVSDQHGTRVAAPFTVPEGVNLTSWHDRVLRHRGDLEFIAQGKHYVVRDAVVTKYVVARLIVESPNPAEEL